MEKEEMREKAIEKLIDSGSITAAVIVDYSDDFSDDFDEQEWAEEIRDAYGDDQEAFLDDLTAAIDDHVRDYAIDVVDMGAAEDVTNSLFNAVYPKHEEADGLEARVAELENALSDAMNKLEEANKRILELLK